MNLPKTVSQKLLLISGMIPSLKKTDRNNDAKFNFVSIDSYYDKVAIVARENGLSWSTTESDFQLFEFNGNTMVKAVYIFTLYTDDGDIVPNFVTLTIVLPFSDAQTSGIAMSYADKLFMRTCFKVVTGEPDADAFAKPKAGNVTELRKGASAKVAPKETYVSPADANAMSISLEQVDDKQKLQQWSVDNKASMSNLKSSNEEAYFKLKNAYTVKYTEFQEEMSSAQ